jgi:chemotaxis protein methyltransferase CheR
MSHTREFKFRRKEFKALQSIVYDRTGINLKDNKEQMVYTRIARRIRALGMQDFAGYLEFLTGPDGAGEVTDFVNAVTTNLTRFFRESHHFTHLRHEVLKAKVEGNRVGVFDKNIRIWSAGCSKGMEPYSIAMTVKASLPRGQGWFTKILATDIDTNMLNHGRAGVYTEDEVGAVPKPLFKRFVNLENGQANMSQELKDMIHFKQLNFMDTSWPIKTKFDAIFCRNVMIYFDQDTQRRLIDRFVNQLDEHGVLYVGHAEALVANHPRLVSVGRSSFRIKTAAEAGA